MEGERIESVKKTIVVLLAQLSAGDKISLVGFNTTAHTIFNEILITGNSDQKALLLAHIDKMVANGGTNMECAIAELGLIGCKPNALVILTDGQINEGISSVAGLHSLIKSHLKTVPVYTLGYGTDHNADLLKSLSQRTFANYSFINDEISLPVSMGDMLGALKTEVASEAAIQYDSRWSCCEPLASVGGNTLELGSVIADKPVWVVFKVPYGLQSSVVNLAYKENNVDYSVSCLPDDSAFDKKEILEQELRCFTGSTLNAVTSLMRIFKLTEAKDLLNKGISLLDSSPVSSRPLVIVMKAQLEETLEGITSALQRRARALPPDLLYRTSSLGGNYSAQRGVTQMADGQTPNVFSSPAQVVASQQMAYDYNSADPVSV